LQSKAVTPRIHRSELLRYVHKPELCRIPFEIEGHASCTAPLLQALKSLYDNYDFNQDPYIISLLEKSNDGGTLAINLLEKVVRNQKTFCSESIAMLMRKAVAVRQNLGSSAADWFILTCISNFEQYVSRNVHSGENWTREELEYLGSQLCRLVTKDLTRPILFSMMDAEGVVELSQHNVCTVMVKTLEPSIASSKVEALLDVLVKEHSKDFKGIVFVQQRAHVFALAWILRHHHRTSHLFNTGTFVGTTSNLNKKWKLAELQAESNQESQLKDFRTGTINLLICTNVLEEGIDVPTCKVVINFDPPANLKSYIQRRGRARQSKSKYIMLLPKNSADLSSDRWHELEEAMKLTYINDARAIVLAEQLESLEEYDIYSLHIQSTG
jgi:hypothetical protein